MDELGLVRVEKSFEVLANELRERILSGAIAEGQALPNERELGDRTGLSRGSVREALRVLEAQGLVSTKAGRNGGRTAQQPTTEFVSGSIQSFIRGRQIAFSGLLETIEALEPALAALAALHRTDQDLGALEEIDLAMRGTDDPASFHRLNAAWHLAVARASHNLLLIAVAEALGPYLHDPRIDDFAADEIRESVLGAHGRVQAAILARDSDAARRRMARHVRAYRARIEQVGPKTVTLP